MCLYLTKRGATYYFRRAIPSDLQAAFDGAKEFTFSLKTKDKDEAKRRRSVEALRTDELLEQARPRLGSVAAPTSATQRLRAPTEYELENERIARQHEAEREARWEARGPLRQRLLAAFEKSTVEITPDEAAARDLLRDLRHEMTVEEERRISRRVRRAEERRGIPADAHTPTAAHSPGENPQGAETTPADAEQGVMLDTTIVDLWAAERKVSKKGTDAHRAVARWFYERAGRKAVDQIIRKDVLTFKSKLVEEGQSPANIKMKLSRLRTILQWAFLNDYASQNAAQGVEIKDTDAAKNKRKPFDIGSLNSIFASPVYAENARPIRGRGEAAYWLPLLALFTGARLEELGQLRAIDVRLEHYHDEHGEERSAWFVHIREDETDGLKLKNAASERVVPVHPELQRLGFVRFVELAKEAQQPRLFPLLKPDKYGRLTAKWGEWWSTYRREACGVTDRRMVFHSFRHTFKDYARHAGIVEGVQRQLMGHSPGDVADEYGSGYSLHQLVEGMRTFRVPGLTVPLAS